MSGAAAPRPSTWTTVGTLGSARRGAVGTRGRVRTWGGWTLDWWVGADDRWHLAGREVAVRQRLVGDAPVVETAMRIPSGDAVARAWAVRDGDLLLVEVENASPVPVALALVLRPVGLDGSPAPVGRVVLDGTTVLVDGRVALVLPKPPGRVAGAAGGEDVADVVLGGRAEARTELAVVSEAGDAQLALVLPLPHTARLRVGLPLAPAAAPPGVGPLSALPGPDQVAAGWAAQAGAGARVELDDPPLASAIAACRAAALLLDDVVLAPALDLWGRPDEAVRRLRGGPADGAESVWLEAVAAHVELAGPERARAAAAFAAPVAETAGRLAEQVRPRRRGAVAVPGSAVAGLAAAASVLRAAGDVRAAGDAEGLAARLGSPATSLPGSADPPPEVDARLAAHLARATSTWTWPPGHDAAAVAELLVLARRLLVADRAGGLDLVPARSERLEGRPCELHDAPTTAGRLSFAVRWHGARPALLWDLEGAPDGTTLRASGLDPTWSTTEPSGEALLRR